MSPSTIMPAAAALLRRSRVRASAQRDRPVTTGSVSGPGRTAPSAMASASIVADAGIDHGIEHVDQKIEDRDQLRRPRVPPSPLRIPQPARSRPTSSVIALIIWATWEAGISAGLVSKRLL